MLNNNSSWNSSAFYAHIHAHGEYEEEQNIYILKTNVNCCHSKYNG